MNKNKISLEILGFFRDIKSNAMLLKVRQNAKNKLKFLDIFSFRERIGVLTNSPGTHWEHWHRTR